MLLQTTRTCKREQGHLKFLPKIFWSFDSKWLMYFFFSSHIIQIEVPPVMQLKSSLFTGVR